MILSVLLTVVFHHFRRHAHMSKRYVSTFACEKAELHPSTLCVPSTVSAYACLFSLSFYHALFPLSLFLRVHELAFASNHCKWSYCIDIHMKARHAYVSVIFYEQCYSDITSLLCTYFSEAILFLPGLFLFTFI